MCHTTDKTFLQVSESNLIGKIDSDLSNKDIFIKLDISLIYIILLKVRSNRNVKYR